MTEEIKITCYGKTKIWTDRQAAIDFYSIGVESCDGSERNRYMNILIDLMAGKIECFDEEEY